MGIGDRGGAARPGRWEGGATVVTRLLAVVAPARMFLGEKDWQQLVVLRRVVADLGLTLTIEACATVREADGLACSSRNAYLSAAQRAQAAALPQALAAAAAQAAAGERRTSVLLGSVRQRPGAAGLPLDYAAGGAAHPLKAVS